MAARRRIHMAWAGLCAFALFSLAAHVAWLRHERFTGSEQAWSAVERMGLSIPLQAQIAVLAVACLGGLAVVVVAFEWLAWRVDPVDSAASSLRWALRPWPMLLVWCGIELSWIPLVSLAAGLHEPFRWIALVAIAFASAWLLPALAWNPVVVARERPPLAWGPASTGVVPVLVWVGTLAMIEALHLASGWSGWQGPWPSSIPVLGLFVGYVAVGANAVVWLSRGSVSWREALACVVRPRVLGAWILLGARLVLPMLLAALVVLPWALWLILVFPRFEQYLRPWGAELPAAWMSTVNASRFMLAWWWALMLSAIMLALPYVSWIAALAGARLLVTLGLVEPVPSATPPTRPDCDPPATAQPTA